MEIGQAVFSLFQDNKFFGSLLLQMETVKDDNVPTAGTDGDKIYYNEKFWNKLSNENQKAILMHEILHIVLGHIWRAGNRDKFRWNLATDFAANLMIDYKLPVGCLIEIRFKGMSAEKIYEKIRLQPIKQEAQSNAKKQTGGHKKWDKKMKGGNAKGKAKMMKKWQKRITQAKNYANSQQKGDVPAWLDRYFKDLEPKEDWRTLLVEYLTNYCDDFTFSPSDRRFLGEDFVLPSPEDKQELTGIAVAIDTSGSIDEKTLAEFIGELKGIVDGFPKVNCKLMFCDCEATKIVELDSFDKSKIRPQGGGGTSFVPVFDKLKNENIKLLIYLTDGEGDFPAKNDYSFDTIWLIKNDYEKVQVPFGQKLEYF